MDSADLCFAFLRAESEAAVTQIIESELLLFASTAWREIDQRDTNSNTINNQASTGSKALTELCTNMVDAVLMKRAYEHGISDLTGPDAPQSVTEAVRTLIGFTGDRTGVLSEIDDDEALRRFAAENLVIGVTGGSRKGEAICFTFADNGEGQHPDAFDRTFLSLSTRNKSDIPFVQGKWNMGGSGVLGYCGLHWYKLIVSRRYDLTGPWGWTLIRQRPGAELPVAEYLTIEGSVPSFEHDRIFPATLRSGEVDEQLSRSSGTIIKLYDYTLEARASTSFDGIREALNAGLVSTVLPFRLYNYRATPSQTRTGRRAIGVDERPLNGMESQLRREARGRASGEIQNARGHRAYERHHVDTVIHPQLGEITITGIVLPQTLPGWLNSNIGRIFHSVNGQVQHTQTRGYLSQRCRFPGLKDRVVLIVDATKMNAAAHNLVWKSDREHVRETFIGQIYLDTVRQTIADSEFLKALQQEFAAEQIDAEESDTQKSLFESLIENDQNIAQLLPQGTLVRRRGRRRQGGEQTEWKGKRSPTFLRLPSRQLQASGIDLAAGAKRRVQLETDVENGWLSRDENPGRVTIRGEGIEHVEYSSSIRDGRVTLGLTLAPSRIEPGTYIDAVVSMIDEEMPVPVECEIRLNVVEVRAVKPPGTRTPKQTDTEGQGDQEQDRLGIPPTRWLTEDGRAIMDGVATDRWPTGYGEQDGGTVEDFGEDGKVYRINYDNAHFQSFLQRARTESERRIITTQYRLGMLVSMMGIEDAFARLDDEGEKERLVEVLEEVRRLSARASATVVMSIAQTIATMVNPEAVSTDSDE